MKHNKKLIELVTGGDELSKLPAPRLQLTWDNYTKKHDRNYSIICHYHLVVPVGKHDIRNPHEYKKDSFLLLQLGGTLSTGNLSSRVYPDGKIDKPFRDGSHIAWDSHRLHLPAFVVCGQKIESIEPRAPSHENSDATSANRNPTE